VGYVGKSVKVGVVEQYRHCVAVYAQVLRQLVVGALHKGGVGHNQRFCAALGNAASHGNGLFLGNAHVHKFVAERRSQIGRNCKAPRHVRRNNHKLVVRLRLAHDVVACNGGVAFGRHLYRRQTRFAVKGQRPVPSFLVGFGALVALALLRVDVYHNRVVDILYLAKYLYQCRNVVTVLLVHVVQAKRLKNVVFACAVCRA